MIGDRITSTFAPSIEGTAVAGSLVKIAVDGRQAGTAVADGNGAWSYAFSNLTDGSHIVSAQVGNSTVRQTSLTIDTQDPVRPVMSTLSVGSDAGVVGDGRTTLVTPTIEGVVEGGATALVYIDRRKTAAIATDATGT